MKTYCKFCESEYYNDKKVEVEIDSKSDMYTDIEMSLDYDIISVYCNWVADDDYYEGELEMKTRINYCPFCGRKL